MTRALYSTTPTNSPSVHEWAGAARVTIETTSRMPGRLQAEGFVEFIGTRQYRTRRRGGLAGMAAS